MADGKNIEVRIAATGGDQAAAEVRKVEAAVESVGDSSSTASEGVKDLADEMKDVAASTKAIGDGDGIDELREQLAGMSDEVQDLQQETEEFAKSQERSSKAIGLGKAAMVGVGIGGAVVVKTFQEISKGIESIDLEKLQQIDPATAAQVEGLKAMSEALQNPLAAIQEMISGTTIGAAFADLNEQISLNVEQQEAAIKRMTSASREMAARLGEAAKEIVRANAVLDAKDQADSAERDAADAARVRAGEAPEDVRIERAAFNRDRDLEKINRQLDPQAAKTQAAFDLQQQAFIDANRVMGAPEATTEDMGKAALAAAQAQSAFATAKKEYDHAREIATEQRRGVRAKYDAEVGDAGGDKAARLAREKDQADRTQQREQAAKQREEAAANRQALEARRESARARLDETAKAAGGRFGTAAERGDANGVAPETVATLRNASNKLSDGTTDNEVSQLAQQIESAIGQMGGTTSSALTGLVTTLQKQAAELKALEAQIKDLRNK